MQNSSLLPETNSALYDQKTMAGKAHIMPVKSGPNYQNLLQQDEFKALIAAKKRFIVLSVLFFLVFYFALPVLATYTDVLKETTFFGITYVWIFALLQFVVVWGLGWVYVKKSSAYDKQAKAILEKNRKELAK